MKKLKRQKKVKHLNKRRQKLKKVTKAIMFKTKMINKIQALEV